MVFGEQEIVPENFLRSSNVTRTPDSHSPTVFDLIEKEPPRTCSRGVDIQGC